jgi:hypothetical protein
MRLCPDLGFLYDYVPGFPEMPVQEKTRPIDYLGSSAQSVWGY